MKMDRRWIARVAATLFAIALLYPFTALFAHIGPWQWGEDIRGPAMSSMRVSLLLTSYSMLIIVAIPMTLNPEMGLSGLRANLADSVSSLKDCEVFLVKELRGIVKVYLEELGYLFLTNHTVSGDRATKIEAEFEQVPGIKKALSYGAEWISKTIRGSSRLRMLVPRVYGLGDLGEILDERAYTQAKDILSSLEAVNDFNAHLLWV
jgi:hypothetical protein